MTVWFNFMYFFLSTFVVAIANRARFYDKKRKSLKEGARNDSSTLKVVVCTRIHYGSEGKLVDVYRLIEFVKNLTYARKIFVCIESRVTSETENYVQTFRTAVKREHFHFDVKFLPISPWGAYVPALNAAVTSAASEGFDVIAFQSLEMIVPHHSAASLLEIIARPHHLVVGAALPGHNFIANTGFDSSTVPVSVPLGGRSCPWNTLAMWWVRYLAITGFPLVSEGVLQRSDTGGGGLLVGGVEEVAAVALQQHLDTRRVAVLARVMGIQWETSFAHAGRKDYHDTKMRSKEERASAQLTALGLHNGYVHHLNLVA